MNPSILSFFLCFFDHNSITQQHMGLSILPFDAPRREESENVIRLTLWVRVRVRVIAL